MTAPLGKEQFEQVGEDPTLDLVMDKVLKQDPRGITDDDLEALVAARRRDRAFNINVRGNDGQQGKKEGT